MAAKPHFVLLGPRLRDGARPAPSGFTLLEIMVALAIFSLAALALLRLQSYGLRTAGDLDGNLMARVVLNNLAVERLSDPGPPALGQANGEVANGGRNWRWTSQTSRTDDARLVSIRLVVTGGADSSPAAITLVRPVEQ